MRILVTGGAGYIGSVTTELLLDRGHYVIVVDNLERGHRQAVDLRAEFVQCDLRSIEDTRRCFLKYTPDAVIHFAAYAYVGESMLKPEIYFNNNVTSAVNIISAMIELGVKKIVFSSSCATYGIPPSIPIVEDMPQVPLSPYGETKLIVEKMLRWISEIKGIKVVSLRYFNACGATERFGEDHDPETHLIPLAIKTALGLREYLEIYGDDYDTYDGTCVRDYIHIVDLAEAHILAVEKDCSGMYNLGIGKGYSVKEVVDCVRRISGVNFPVKIGQRRPGDSPVLIASNHKAMKELGWKPRYTELEDMVLSAWLWHKLHPYGYGC